MTTFFTPSQLSYKQETSPINFRISPLKLLWSDLKLVPFLPAAIPQILLPLRTMNPRAELNLLTPGNVITIVLHILLGIGTLVGVIGYFVGQFVPFPGFGLKLYVATLAAIWTPGKVKKSEANLQISGTLPQLGLRCGYFEPVLTISRRK